MLHCSKLYVKHQLVFFFHLKSYTLFNFCNIWKCLLFWFILILDRCTLVTIYLRKRGKRQRRAKSRENNKLSNSKAQHSLVFFKMLSDSIYINYGMKKKSKTLNWCLLIGLEKKIFAFPCNINICLMLHLMCWSISNMLPFYISAQTHNN